MGSGSTTGGDRSCGARAEFGIVGRRPRATRSKQVPKLDNRLRAKLRELGLPYHQLARQVGVSSTMMRRIVYAKADPRLEVALKIAVVLECPFAELFSVEGAACAGEPGRRG